MGRSRRAALTVDVIVPWRGGCPHREAAWAWVRARYRETFPGWCLRPSSAPPGPWCKGRAVAHAAASSTADILVVADADVWTPGIGRAVLEVARGAPWAMPHHLLRRLSRASTQALLEGASIDDESLDQPAYRGLDGGGIVVLSSEVFAVVPIDPRFTSWGQEDESWAAALWTLLGPAWRGRDALIHLWHPPQERASRRHGSQANWALRRRYLRTRRDPRAMTALIGEAHDHLGPSDPALHGGASHRV